MNTTTSAATTRKVRPLFDYPVGRGLNERPCDECGDLIVLADRFGRKLSDGRHVHKACSDKAIGRSETGGARLITCARFGECFATFFLVPTRQFPWLCLDHAADASREVDGWTPENSAD